MKAVFAVDAVGGYVRYGPERNGPARSGQMPWEFGDYKDDRNFYLNMTSGKKLLMGRGTWESFTNEQKRKIVDRSTVVTQNPNSLTPHSRRILDANNPLGEPARTEDKYPESTSIHMMRQFADDDVVVIGGPMLIDHLLDQKLISELYITRIPHIHRADRFWTPKYNYFSYRAYDFAETHAGIKIHKIARIDP